MGFFTGFRTFKILILSLLLLWNLGIFYEFLMNRTGSPDILLPFLSIGYSNVCHQADWKSISSGPFHALVCSRCSGIYAGALIFSLISVFARKNFYIKDLRLFAVLLIPMPADVILYNTGLYNYSKTAAFITGFLSGSAVFLYILGAFFKIFNNRDNKGST